LPITTAGADLMWAALPSAGLPDEAGQLVLYENSSTMMATVLTKKSVIRLIGALRFESSFYAT
jgi:methionine synthase I (cobalamin-dependent)